MENSYIEALLWSSDSDYPEESFDGASLSSEALESISKDCERFEERAWKILDRYYAQDWTLEQLGHDFALTRNGHGAGFWDRPELYGEKCAVLLTTLSHRFGESTPYLGDDGKIYLG